MSVVQLVIKVDIDLKDTFSKVCKSQESDSSKELRKFMKSYIQKYGQVDLFLSSKNQN